MRSKEMMSFFLLDAAPASRRWPSDRTNRFMQALIGSLSVFSRKGPPGQKNASPVVNAFSMNTAAYAPSPAEQNICLTVPAESPWKTAARFDPINPVSGNSSTRD